MPETALGLFPDIGASYFLSRLPGFYGDVFLTPLFFKLFSSHIAIPVCYEKNKCLCTVVLIFLYLAE